MRVNTLSYLLHGLTVYADKKRQSSHITPCLNFSVSDLLTTLQSIAYHLTVITKLWKKVILNSLDVDFIHSDFHDRLGKDIKFEMVCYTNNINYFTYTSQFENRLNDGPLETYGANVANEVLNSNSCVASMT